MLEFWAALPHVTIFAQVRVRVRVRVTLTLTLTYPLPNPNPPYNPNPSPITLALALALTLTMFAQDDCKARGWSCTFLHLFDRPRSGLGLGS